MVQKRPPKSAVRSNGSTETNGPADTRIWRRRAPKAIILLSTASLLIVSIFSLRVITNNDSEFAAGDVTPSSSSTNNTSLSLSASNTTTKILNVHDVTSSSNSNNNVNMDYSTSALFPVQRIDDQLDPNLMVFAAAHRPFLNNNNNNNTKLQQQNHRRPIMAICTATRSPKKLQSVESSQLQIHLIKSIAQTVTAQEAMLEWDVHLFLAVDDDDPFWVLQPPQQQNQNHSRFTQLVLPAWLTLTVAIVPRIPNHVPFNEIVTIAYRHGAEYYCRVNDDTAFETSGWITAGVAVLQNYDPPNVGVVGPECAEGNEFILTHDLVHRTHMEIFEKEYYPEEFKNWFLDDWITFQYRRNMLGVDRSTKLLNGQWRVRHWEMGTRYEFNGFKDGEMFLASTLKRGQEQILRYLQRHFQNHTTTAAVARQREHQRMFPVAQQQQQQQQHGNAKDEKGWMRLTAATNSTAVVTRAESSETKKPMLAILTSVPSHYGSEPISRLQKDLINSLTTTVTIAEASETWDVHLYVAVEDDTSKHSWTTQRSLFLDLEIPNWLTVTVGSNTRLQDIAQAAYHAGAEYLCRVPHNIEMITADWISMGVAVLQNYDPPNIGVVGPSNYEHAGKVQHFTTHMVHRTHLRIFDQKYYPEEFNKLAHPNSRWFVDKWITTQYGKTFLGGQVDRSTKLDAHHWFVADRWTDEKLRPNERFYRNSVEHQMLRDALVQGRYKIRDYLRQYHNNHTMTAAIGSR